MSNALAIATVTCALAQIVDSAVKGAVGGAEVSIGRPESPAGGSSLHKVQLYLYQITPNPALRNEDLPTRGADGKLTQRPRVALDLFYLLAFYGQEISLEPQRMLGAVMRDLHSQPILARQTIEDAVASNSFLEGSNLAEAVEHIRFTPIPLSLEELSKLWSIFFQTPHVLSVAYKGSVVMIEGVETPSVPLPVLKRGEADRGMESVLGLFPLIEKIHLGVPEDAGRRPPPPSYPSARLGMLLTIEGSTLGGDAVRVRFSHPRLKDPEEITIPVKDRTEEQIIVTLPDDAGAQDKWAAGIYTLTVIIQSPRFARDVATNSLSFPLAPQLTEIKPNPVSRDFNGDATLTISCHPEVLPTQSASMLLGALEIPAINHPDATDTLTFIVGKAPLVKDQAVYLRVDGVNSLPIIRTGQPPRLEFDPAQKVTIT